MGKLYALLTEECNLHCPHCDIKKESCPGNEFNFDAFMETINNFDGQVILFGGEPTLYEDRLYKVYYNNPVAFNKINSITTNLIKLNDRLMVLFQIIHFVGTSWNPGRFSEKEYELWKNNVRTLREKVPSVHIKLLVTLTKELLSMEFDDIVNIMKEWNELGFNCIQFEPYVGSYATPEYFVKSDEFLSRIYDNWNNNFNFYLNNIDIVKHHIHNCDDVYTLFPNGTMRKGCPHNIENVNPPEECYLCEKSGSCRPCHLQCYCSYPHNFAKKVMDGGV